MDYYKVNMDAYFRQEIDKDMKMEYNLFKHNFSGKKIVDLTCDTGRDSAYFKTLGYDVISLDRTNQFFGLAKKHLNVDIEVKYAKDFNINCDAIWAYNSFRNLNSDDLKETLNYLYQYLPMGGIILCAFEIGFDEGPRESGYNNQMTIDKMAMLKSKFEIVDYAVKSGIISIVLLKNTI